MAVIAAFVLKFGPGDSTLSASADLSVESKGSESDQIEVFAEITAVGDDLDGVALVNEDGDVVAHSDEGASTSGTVTFTYDGTADEDDEFDDDSSETFSVYGFSGTVDDTIDDTDAIINFGTVDNPAED